MTLFAELTTLDDLRAAVSTAYGNATGTPSTVLGTSGGPLPLAFAEPGPLMERAVELAGPDGLTLQELRQVFLRVGQERFDRGVATMRSSGRVSERKEKRPNRAGRIQSQVVFRASRGLTAD